MAGRPQIGIAGSDAHTRASAGTTYTEVPGARNKEEFLAGLRAGRTRVCGGEGSFVKLTCDLLRIGGEALQENPWVAAFGPIILGTPAAVLFHSARELAFAKRWAARVLDERQPQRASIAGGLPAPVPGGKG